MACHETGVFRYARAMCATQPDAEDVLQETFVDLDALGMAAGWGTPPPAAEQAMDWEDRELLRAAIGVSNLAGDLPIRSDGCGFR
jgi:hypothetical protein